MSRRSTLRTWLGRAGLAGLSLLVCLVCLEGGLRLWVPRYAHAADAVRRHSRLRIMERTPNAVAYREHPDTGRKHPVIHNNLAMRQSRNIALSDLRDQVNVGFFGDSYTENVRIDAPYMFVELLDFLLREQGARVNVLNFGVDGYGTDQSYLYWREWVERHPLDHVFYVLCRNDLSDVYANHLFALGEDGVLMQQPVLESSLLHQFLSRLYCSYFFLEVKLRIQSGRTRSAEALVSKLENRTLRQQRDERYTSDLVVAINERNHDLRAAGDLAANPDYQDTVALFQALVETWDREVTAAGGRFHVVLLPHPAGQAFHSLVPDGIHVIDLYQAFQARIPGYEFNRDIRFANDGHWDEHGNAVAGLCLYDEVGEWLGVTGDSDRLPELLYSYYAGVGGDWFPDERYVKEVEVPPARRAAIRQRYRELEGVEAPAGSSP